MLFEGGNRGKLVSLGPVVAASHHKTWHCKQREGCIWVPMPQNKHLLDSVSPRWTACGLLLMKGDFTVQVELLSVSLTHLSFHWTRINHRTKCLLILKTTCLNDLGCIYWTLFLRSESKPSSYLWLVPERKTRSPRIRLPGQTQM